MFALPVWFVAGSLLTLMSELNSSAASVCGLLAGLVVGVVVIALNNDGSSSEPPVMTVPSVLTWAAFSREMSSRVPNSTNGIM